jgi:hypothetical protein
MKGGFETKVGGRGIEPLVSSVKGKILKSLSKSPTSLSKLVFS